jgi:hypothetical protein
MWDTLHVLHLYSYRSGNLLKRTVLRTRRIVIGVGPRLGYIFPIGDLQGYVNLKAYWEFAGQDRPSGWNAWLTLSFSPSAVASAPSLIVTK